MYHTVQNCILLWDPRGYIYFPLNMCFYFAQLTQQTESKITQLFITYTVFMQISSSKPM